MSTTNSRAQLLTGRVLTGLAVAFLLLDSLMKVAQSKPSIEASTTLGYPVSTVFGIGLVELIALVLYVVPRTSFIGAVLLTAHLGGAIATHVRVGNPLFSHVLFPTYVALFIWGGLYLRDSRLRAVWPIRAHA